MIRIIRYAFACMLLIVPTLGWSYENITVEDEAQDCYSMAMIGMDSVINSRMGVPAEHALPLSLKLGAVDVSESAYDKNLLIVMLSAYLWDNSPHSYALKVFYNCAVTNRQLQSASVAITH